MTFDMTIPFYEEAINRFDYSPVYTDCARARLLQMGFTANLFIRCRL